MGNCNCGGEQKIEACEVVPQIDINQNEQTQSKNSSMSQKNILKNSTPSQLVSYKQLQQIQKSFQSQQLGQSSFADLTKPVNLGFQLSGILDAHKCDKNLSASISESISQIKNQKKRQQIEEQLNIFLGYTKQEKESRGSEKNIEIYENDINKQLELDAIGNVNKLIENSTRQELLKKNTQKKSQLINKSKPFNISIINSMNNQLNDNDKFMEHQILEFMDDNQKYEQNLKKHQPDQDFATVYNGQVDKLLSSQCKIVLGKLANFKLDQVPNDAVVSHIYYQLKATQDVYIGMWKEKKMNGHGKTYFKDGSMYEGTYLNNQIHGLGRLVYANGNYYSGQFQNGKYNGTGQLTLENGDEFMGNFQNGMLNGSGQYKKNQGKELYKGQFKDNLKWGQGELVVQDIYKYTGNFIQDQMNGQGSCEWLNKKIYIGNWLNNQMHGEGKLIWNNGKQFIGLFKNDKMHGKGLYQDKDGGSQEGVWENGQKQGNFTVLESNGSRYQVTYKDDNEIKKIKK